LHLNPSGTRGMCLVTGGPVCCGAHLASCEPASARCLRRPPGRLIRGIVLRLASGPISGARAFPGEFIVASPGIRNCPDAGNCDCIVLGCISYPAARQERSRCTAGDDPDVRQAAETGPNARRPTTRMPRRTAVRRRQTRGGERSRRARISGLPRGGGGC
jgi:hypothetical protein